MSVVEGVHHYMVDTLGQYRSKKDKCSLHTAHIDLLRTPGHLRTTLGHV